MSQLRLSHWGSSAALHGTALLLLLALQAGLHKPAAEKTIEWDVSVVEAAPPPANPTPQPPQTKPLPTPRSTPTPRPQEPSPAPAPITAPPAPSVANTVPPVQTPVVAPPPPPVNTVPEKPLADSAWLANNLWGLMNGRKRYPLQARRMGIEGKVVIDAEIDEHGEIIRAEIKQSSGSVILDQDALSLLKSVAPLKVDKMRLAPRTKVQIPVAYALE